MYISVGYQADEQWEELNFMLGQEAFKQDNGDSQQRLEQQGGTMLSSGFQQKLQNSESNHTSSVIEIRPDLRREQRKGVPEVIFGEAKAPGQIIAMTRSLLAETGRAIISRVQPEAVEALRESWLYACSFDGGWRGARKARSATRGWGRNALLAR